MVDELVSKKLELLAAQRAKVDRIQELLNGGQPCKLANNARSAPCSYAACLVLITAGYGGFNEASRKTCKNLEAAITMSKRPGYLAYYEQPDHLQALVRSGEVARLQEQVVQLQKQIDQLTEKIDSANVAISITNGQLDSAKPSASVHNLTQWFATCGSPKQGADSNQYTNFTPNKKVYGGTSHYAVFRSQSSTMKNGRLTK
ncbi:hypothetical protein FI667_g13456, partial [Globisporangium splendens]